MSASSERKLFDFLPIDMVLGILYSANRLGRAMEGTTRIHLVPFFIQEEESINLGLYFIDNFGPYNPTIQNNLQLSVDGGLVDAESILINPIRRLDYVYSISESGLKFFSEQSKDSIDEILPSIEKVVNEVINVDMYELLKKAYILWEK